MSLIKCKECGAEISDKALTCPNCGAPQRAPIEQLTSDTGNTQHPTAVNEGISLSRPIIYLASTIAAIICSLLIAQNYMEPEMTVIQVLFILAALINLVPQIQNIKDYVDKHKLSFLYNANLQCICSVLIVIGAVFTVVVYIGNERPIFLPLLFLLVAVINLLPHIDIIKRGIKHVKAKVADHREKMRLKTMEKTEHAPNKTKRTIIIAIAGGVVAIILGFAIFGGGIGSLNNSGGGSIDGTYTWTDGFITHKVSIYGDSWYGVTKYGRYGEEKTESGTVKNNKLYLDGTEFLGGGIMAIGTVSGNHLRWGTHTLQKQ